MYDKTGLTIAGHWRIGDTDSLVRVDNMTREHQAKCHERLQASFFSHCDFTGSKTKMKSPYNSSPTLHMNSTMMSD